LSVLPWSHKLEKMIPRSFYLTGLCVALACSEPAGSPPPVAHVEIVPGAPIVGVRDTFRLTAVLTDAGGHVLTGRAIAWTSLAPGTIAIDSGGLARGLLKGTGVVRAIAEGRSAEASITVRYIFAHIGAGTNYTCATTSGDEGFCWGANDRGQLGTGTAIDTAAPALINGDPSITVVMGNRTSGFGRHTCALDRANGVLCWGDNALGQLGRGGNTPSPTPVPVSGLASPVTVATGNAHSCAVSSTGAASCWGWNNDGQLGAGDTTTRSTPAVVTGGLTFVAVSPGSVHTCGIVSAGYVYCWGGNPNREYGVDTTGASLVPHLVSPVLHFSRIAAGTYHTCGLTTTGAAYCWGGNVEGQLGTGDTASALTPQPVLGGRAYVDIVSGSYHTCAIATSGLTYCWGYNATDQLGVSASTTFQSPMPVQVSSSVVFSSLTAGYGHTCGLTTTGDIYCWGDNRRGQLGDGTLTGGPSAVKVSSP
jgi:alpha-tubulin suppressor-like RCC1 family protein